MPKYSPVLYRLNVCALYHEAMGGVCMTHLADELIAKALAGSSAMQQAMDQLQEKPSEYKPSNQT